MPPPPAARRRLRALVAALPAAAANARGARRDANIEPTDLSEEELQRRLAEDIADANRAELDDETIPLHWRLSQVPAGPVGPRTSLTDDEKRQLYHDGFLILRGMLTRDITERARRKFNTSHGAEKGSLMFSEEFLGLLNDSCVGDLLRTEMGPFTPAMACQVAVTPPSPSPNPGTGPWPQYGNP